MNTKTIEKPEERKKLPACGAQEGSPGRLPRRWCGAWLEKRKIRRKYRRPAEALMALE